jgi:hypothetical protein
MAYPSIPSQNRLQAFENEYEEAGAMNLLLSCHRFVESYATRIAAGNPQTSDNPLTGT